MTSGNYQRFRENYNLGDFEIELTEFSGGSKSKGGSYYDYNGRDCRVNLPTLPQEKSRGNTSLYNKF